MPAAKGACSKTPIGPFQMIVRLSRSASAKWRTVAGPMSRPMRSGGIASLATTRPSGASGEAATTVSTRQADVDLARPGLLEEAAGRVHQVRLERATGRPRVPGRGGT